MGRRSRRNAKLKKSWIQKCKDCLRQFMAFLFSNVGIICLVVGYTLAGAFMFKEIEGNSEEDTFMRELQKFYNDTLENLWESASESPHARDGIEFQSTTERELRTFQTVIMKGVKNNDYDGTKTYSERWTIDAAFLYCLTVITTIGYGNVFPHTVGGKVATIVYAIFGMPLFLLYLSNIGDLLAKSFKWLYAKFCLCKICSLRKRRTLSSETTTCAPAISRNNSWRRSASYNTWSNGKAEKRVSETTDDDDSRDEDTETETSSSSTTISSKDPQDITVPVSLCLAIMIGFISLGAVLFTTQDEQLNFMDGSYFCFISLSTIGFGDIVPKTNSNREAGTDLQWNFILCSVYLMLGMALIAMCFNLMQQDVVQKIRTCTDIIRRLARCRR